MDNPMPTEIETYKQWLDRLIGKNQPPLEQFINTEYIHFKQTHAMVMEEIGKKYGDEQWYQEHQPDIRRMLGDAVAMTIYIKEQRIAEENRKKEADESEELKLYKVTTLGNNIFHVVVPMDISLATLMVRIEKYTYDRFEYEEKEINSVELVESYIKPLDYFTSPNHD